MRRLLALVSLLMFAIGCGALALSLYMWFGAWPAQMKEIVDYERSVAASEHEPPPPLIMNVPARKTTSLGQGYFLTWVTTYMTGEDEVVGRQLFRIFKFDPTTIDLSKLGGA